MRLFHRWIILSFRNFQVPGPRSGQKLRCNKDCYTRRDKILLWKRKETANFHVITKQYAFGSISLLIYIHDIELDWFLSLLTKSVSSYAWKFLLQTQSMHVWFHFRNLQAIFIQIDEITVPLEQNTYMLNGSTQKMINSFNNNITINIFRWKFFKYWFFFFWGRKSIFSI